MYVFPHRLYVQVVLEFDLNYLILKYYTSCNATPLYPLIDSFTLVELFVYSIK
jgi:hypothetical protein